jgi:YgiT-type zinc finger domain-containing protein
MVERSQSEGQEMKCIHCRGEMKQGHTPFHADRRGCHVTIDEIPAWVCGQCGEAYFEEKEVDAIQKLIAAIEQEFRALAPTA